MIRRRGDRRPLYGKGEIAALCLVLAATLPLAWHAWAWFIGLFCSCP